MLTMGALAILFYAIIKSKTPVVKKSTTNSNLPDGGLQSYPMYPLTGLLRSLKPIPIDTIPTSVLDTPTPVLSSSSSSFGGSGGGGIGGGGTVSGGTGTSGTSISISGRNTF